MVARSRRSAPTTQSTNPASSRRTQSGGSTRAGAAGNLQVPQTSADKTAAFNAALAEAHGQPSTEATTPKKKATKQSSAKQASTQESSAQGAEGTTQDEPAGTAETNGGDAEAA